MRHYSADSHQMKFTLEVSQDTFEMLNSYLAESDHLVLLHILNTTVEVNITETKIEPFPDPSSLPKRPNVKKKFN